MSSEGVCAFTQAIDDGYRPDGFRDTPLIKFVHNRVPRFGNPNNILVLIEGTDEEKNDYLRGLLACSIAMFAVFLVWSLILIFMKYRGPQKYGWLSGRRNPIPPKPSTTTSNEHAPKENDEQEKTEEAKDPTKNIAQIDDEQEDVEENEHRAPRR